MMKLAFLLTVVGCVFAGTVLPSVTVPKLDGRIVGGSTTTINAHPYQVSLMRNGVHICGGSLTGARAVVTAAHCLSSGLPASSYSIRVGSSSRTSGGTVIRVSSYTIHGNYNGGSHANDGATIVLASNAPLSSTVATIPLATSTPGAGTSCVVTGWGTLSEGGSSAGSSAATLQQVTVQIVARSTCQSNYGSRYDIGASMLCAGTAGKDACQGDSGGPLVCGGRLVGIVSWGIGCARAGYPGVYADVANMRSFLA